MEHLEGLESKQKKFSGLLDSIPVLTKLSPKLVRPIARFVDAAFGLPKIDMASVQNLDIPLSTCSKEIKLRTYHPKTKNTAGALVYYHGGGCVVGDLETHDRLVRFLAHYGQVSVISVAYRLAPEAKYPQPVCDAIDAWNWINENLNRLGCKAGPMGLAGDSAGGYLATLITLQEEHKRLAVKSRFQADYQLLVYPMVDLHKTSNSYQKYDKGLIISTRMMDYFIKHYLDDDKQADDYLASPVLSRYLNSCPRTHIVTAEFDPLKDCCFAYKNKLDKAGVKVTHEHLGDCLHAFPTLGGVSQRARDVCQQLGEQVKSLHTENQDQSVQHHLKSA